MSRLIKAGNKEELKARSIHLKPVPPVKTGKPESQLNNRNNEIGPMAVNKDQLFLQTKKQEAQNLVAKVERELQRAREAISEEEQESRVRMRQAYEESKNAGFEEGFEQGKRSAMTEYSSLIQQAEETVNHAKKEYHRYLVEAEPIILQLALTVANRIMYRSLQENDIWMDIVKNAVQEVRDHDSVTIYVPPARYEETKTQRQEIESLLGRAQELVILPDAALTENACIIETPYGKIDASLDSQLEEMKIQLMERLKEGSR
ncbi:flagellar assembly protein FliH [Alteribacillus sp. HJP-4]|uniref:flagellar assembly protein FliH n=1 Tax=Alteribacillus sp. HJP-4 TaxID=2775394 RepID=UPI0035CCE607